MVFEASYKLGRRSGNTLYLSGHLPKAMDGSFSMGKVGTDVTSQYAESAARLCAIHLIATMKGDLFFTQERRVLYSIFIGKK